jgi:hypothetical protein
LFPFLVSFSHFISECGDSHNHCIPAAAVFGGGGGGGFHIKLRPKEKSSLSLSYKLRQVKHIFL